MSDENTRSHPTKIGFPVWLAAAVLLLVSGARYDGFVYGNYPAALVLQAGIALLLAAIGLRAARGLSPLRGFSSAEKLFAAYALLMLLSPLWAPSRRLAAVGAITAVQGVAWMLLISRLVRSEREILCLLRAMVVAGVVASLLALYYTCIEPVWIPRYFHLIHGDDLLLPAFFRMALQSSRVEYVQGHRNFLAIFLLAPILICLADLFGPLIMRGAPRRPLLGWPMRFVVYALILMLFAFVLCKAVGGIVGIVVGIAILAFIRMSRKWRRAMLALAGGVALLGVLVLAALQIGLWLLDHSGSQATRWHMWRGVLKMIADRPFLGWGAGMFLPNFADFKPDLPMRYGWLTSLTIYPHNELLLVAVEGGLVALALYLLGFVVGIRDLFRRIAGPKDARTTLIGWALLAGFGAMFAHSLVSIALRYWAPTTMFWTMAGMMLAFSHLGASPETERTTLEKPRLLQWAGCTTAAVAILAFVAVPGGCAEWLTSRGQLKLEKMAGGDDKDAIERRNIARMRTNVSRLEAAEGLSRYVPDYFIALRVRGLTLWKLGELEKSVAAWEKMNRLAPGYDKVRTFLGVTLKGRAMEIAVKDRERAGELFVRGVAVLRRAVKETPYDYDARLELVRSLPRDEAIRYAREGVEIAPERVEGHAILCETLVRFDRSDEARASFEKAAELLEANREDHRRWAARLKRAVEMAREHELTRRPAIRR